MDEKPDDAAEVEMTAEMIAAGVSEFCSCHSNFERAGATSSLKSFWR